MRDEYLFLVLLKHFLSKAYDDLFGADWISEEQQDDIAEQCIDGAFARLELAAPRELLLPMYKEVFNELVANGAIEFEGDDYTKSYLRLKPQEKTTVIKRLIADSAAEKLLGRLGGKRNEAYKNAVSKALIEYESDEQGAFRAERDGIFEDHHDGSYDGKLQDNNYSILETFSDSAIAEIVPAADRLVTLNHNSPEVAQVSDRIAEIYEQARTNNEFGNSREERERLLASLEAAKTYWGAAQLKTIQIKVGVVMALEDAHAAFTAIGKALGISLVVDLIKSIIKNQTGVEI